MLKNILFIVIFTILFSWALNLNTLSQILAEKNQRRTAAALAIFAGLLLSLNILFLLG
jgi:hypothetical protein